MVFCQVSRQSSDAQVPPAPPPTERRKRNRAPRGETRNAPERVREKLSGEPASAAAANETAERGEGGGAWVDGRPPPLGESAGRAGPQRSFGAGERWGSPLVGGCTRDSCCSQAAAATVPLVIRQASRCLGALGPSSPMCELLDSQQPAEKLSRMKKLRRTLSESFGRLALNKDDNGFDEVSYIFYFKFYLNIYWAKYYKLER
ncbi:uncharacterized protein LOC120305636 [Crotalus tigris]|uniref:uncharacterized protein LOC120305636 n=1 Tax=Crotalus tigris TaxID=88082 RepID=UPI00192F549D|nr:uncharacterized protein LOC120305636 [Crotalus tigris]